MTLEGYKTFLVDPLYKSAGFYLKQEYLQLSDHFSYFFKPLP